MQTNVLADGFAKIAAIFQSMADELKAEPKQAPAPVQEKEEPPQKEEPAPQEKKKQLTEADVRVALAAKAREGKTEEAKAIIAKYGAAMVSQLDPEHYAAVIKEAEGIK